MLSHSLNFHKLVRFQSDPVGGAPATPAGDDPAAATSATPATPATPKTFTQEEVNVIMGKTRTQQREIARKEVEAEFKAQQEAEKAELEKKALQEQGQFKELASKAEADKLAADKRAKDAEESARKLKLELEFDRSNARNNLTFVNEQARKRAFDALDLTKIGDEDTAGDMDKAVKELNKAEPYYYGEIEVVETDGAKRGKRPSEQQLTDERKKELAKKYPAIARRPT